MKKFYMMALLAASIIGGANAQTMNTPFIVGGDYMITANDLTLSWGDQEIEFVSSMNMGGYDICTTFLGLKSQSGTSFTSEGYVVLTTATQQQLGQGGEDNMANNAIMVMMWDPDVLDNSYNPRVGDYTLTVPAGIVKLKNNPGVTNAKFETTIHILKENYSGADVTPTPGDAYLPSELKTVEVTWKNNGGALCNLAYGAGDITYHSTTKGTSVDGGTTAEVFTLPKSAYKFDDTKLVLDLSSITEPDNYSFTIPSSFVIMNGNMMASETEFNYTITAIPTFGEAIRITESNSTSKNLVFSYEEAVSLKSNSGVTAQMAVNDYFMKDATALKATDFTFYANEEDVAKGNSTTSGKFVSVDLSAYLTDSDNGKVVYVKLPQGLFVNSKNYENPEQTLDYTFELPESPIVVLDQQPNVTPSAEEPLTKLSNIQLSWNLVLERTFEEKVQVTFVKEGTTKNLAQSANVLGDYTTLSISLDVLTPGLYTLTVPENYVYITKNGVKYYNPEVTATYKIVPGVLNTLPFSTPEAETAVKELSKITLTWNLPLIKNAESDQEVEFNTFDNDGIEPLAEDNLVKTVNVEENDIIVTLNKLEDGAYVLSVPAEFVIITKDEAQYYNNAFNLIYLVDSTSGINILNSDGQGLYNVYTLTGVKLATGDASVVKDLPKGLYIINGKKVAL